MRQYIIPRQQREPAGRHAGFIQHGLHIRAGDTVGRKDLALVDTLQRVQHGSDGIEYLVTLEDGRTVTIVQFQEVDEEMLAPGADVYIQHGWNTTRVVERSGQVGPLPFGAWRNPDDLPPDAETYDGGIEIIRRRTGIYSDLDRPTPEQKRKRVIGF